MELLITSMYASLSIVITFANLLVILSVHSTRALRKVTNYSLVSLAFADLAVGVVVLPVRISEVQDPQKSQDFSWCLFSLSLTLLSLSASVLNLLIVTVERYFAIILPLTYSSKVTARRNFYAIILVWFIAILASFLPFVTLGNMAARERSREHKICRFADTMSPEYLTVFSAAIVLIPTLFISAAYLKIYLAAVQLRRRLKALHVQRDPDRNVAKMLKESKAARTVGIVVGVFYLCWIPFMVAVILSAFVENLITPVVVLVISVLIYSNSAINPVLYGYLNRDFRLAYKRMFSKISLPKACARIHPRERSRCYELPDISTSSQQSQGVYTIDSVL